MLGRELPREPRPVHNPRQIRRFHPVINDGAGYTEACRDDPSSAGLFQLLRCVGKKIRDDFVKRREQAALITVFGDLRETPIPALVQGEVALGATDVSRQNHERLPGLPRLVLAGLNFGGAGRPGPEGASRAAAASSTRKRSRPSRGWTICAGNGGSVLPPSTARKVSAFSAPTTRKSTRCEALSTGSVKVIRRALSFATI